MKSAIVLDGHLKSALAIARSLGRRGIPVVAGSVRDSGMALHSRYVLRSFVYPSPYTDPAGFIESVEAEAKTCGDMPVVCACSDVTFLLLYDARERVGKVATLVFPDDRAMEIAFDKAVTYSLARVIGIPTITSYIPTSVGELTRVSESVVYPAVVKSRKSVTLHKGLRHFASAIFVHDKKELIKVFDELHERLGEAPMIQERLVGEEYGVETIARRGEPYVCVVHRRIRSLSPSGGASVLKETIEDGPLKDMLEAYAQELMRNLRWEGPIMVEFKVDSDSKIPKLMEVNGRFWGSLPLSIAARVDMPFAFYCLATQGVFPEERMQGERGVITRHFFGDLRSILSVLFKRDPMRTFVYPKRQSALLGFLFPPKGTKGDIWSWDDPKPALYEIIDIVERTWK